MELLCSRKETITLAVMNEREDLMDIGSVVMSYTLSALSGICFITGLAVLFGGRSGKYGKF